MPQTTEELVDLLRLEAIEPGIFRGPHPDTLFQRLFGGQVLAQALTAAHQAAPPDRLAHSLNAYFLRPGRVDTPMIFEVESLRDGGSFSSRRVVARQRGEVIFALSASFQVPEDGLDHHDPLPVSVPPPQDCPPLVDVLARRFGGPLKIFEEWDALDVRWADDSTSYGTMAANSHGAHMRVWAKTTGPLPADQHVHRAILAYLSDITLLSVSTLPHRVIFMSPQMQAASIDHAMWFHREVFADRWLLYDMVSPSASHARGFSTGRLFQEGHLVASCAQEGLIRMVG
ncbi:MAG: acyl-CoA thioesterase II [Propionibacteriaceae bacterium]|nr:acyl-CoA thioesterase II [Propionibacteriaceae bacterium]